MARTPELNALIEKLEKGIGTGPAQQHIIDEVVKGYESSGKYAQGAIDRLHELRGVDKMWADKDEAKDENGKALTDEDRIAMIDKAIAILQG